MNIHVCMDKWLQSFMVAGLVLHLTQPFWQLFYLLAEYESILQVKLLFLHYKGLPEYT